MKTLPLQTIYYEYLLRSYQEWLQTIGYADPTVNNWPAHVRELLHYLETKNILHITLVNSYHLQDFIYYIKYRKNTVRPGALSSNSINTIINALNSFARYINSSGKYVLDYVPERMENDMAIPTVLTVQEIKDLYEATFLPHRENNVAMGQRDRAIIAVFYGRRMEYCQQCVVELQRFAH